MLNFVDPPERSGRGSWQDFIDELSQHPGKWVLWKQRTYRQVARHLAKRYPNVETRCVSVERTEKGVYLVDIYVRWIVKEEIADA